MAQRTISNTRRTNHSVKWLGSPYDLGFVDEVNPDIKIITEPIMVGTFGKVKLGDRIIQLDGQIHVDCREITEELIKKMMPWWSSGVVPLIPSTLNVDYYSYAALLTLHPEDKGADVDED